MKTFVVYRTEAKKVVNEIEKENYNEADQVQFEGVEFSDGRVVIRWCAATKSCSVWDSMEDLKKVHIYAHPDYGTKIIWQNGLMESL